MWDYSHGHARALLAEVLRTLETDAEQYDHWIIRTQNGSASARPRTPPKDQIRMRDRPVCYSTQSRGLSGQTTLNEGAQRKREDVMSVAMNQPHRIGVSPFPDDAWMATALGRFCRAHWRDKDTQRGYWGQVGERYAQLVDAERIARG